MSDDRLEAGDLIMGARDQRLSPGDLARGIDLGRPRAAQLVEIGLRQPDAAVGDRRHLAGEAAAGIADELIGEGVIGGARRQMMRAEEIGDAPYQQPGRVRCLLHHRRIGTGHPPTAPARGVPAVYRWRRLSMRPEPSGKLAKNR